MVQRVPGHVLDVTTRTQGAVGTSWTGTTLRVINARDLERDGGTFVLDADPATVYHFTAVVEGDTETDPDTVTTVETAPANLGTDGVGEFPLTVWPEAVETFASVQAYEQDDAILVTVPHALKPLLADGVRAPEDRESVEVELRGTEWTIAAVVGRRPTVQPEALPWLDADLTELRDRLAQANTDLEQAKTDLAAADKATTDALAQAKTDLAAADKTNADALTAAQQALNAADLGLQRGLDTVTAAAKAADDKAAAAQTSANGKNTVTASTAAPTSSTGAAVGDLWMQTGAGGTVTGMWTWTALGWVPRPVDSQAIANLDVGKLTASSASISSVVATKLAADFGAYKVLTADKLVVGSATNLIYNGALELGSSRGWDPRLTYQTTDVPTGLPGALNCPASQQTIYPMAPAQFISVTPGQQLLLEFWVKADKPGSAMVLEFRAQPDGGNLGSPANPWRDLTTGLSTGNHPFFSSVPTEWTKVQRIITVRPGVSRIYFDRLYLNHSSGSEVTAAQSIAGMTLRMRNSGELIVDGAITANSIAASAVTVDKLAALAVTAEKVAANAITARHIAAGAITTDKLVALAITGDKIAANAVTTDKLVVDQAFAQSVAATVATFQTVWAGKITGNVIQADALNGKTIQGADIYTPSKASTPRIHLGGSVFEVVRKPDADSPEVQTVSLGGVSADQFSLSAADGTPGVTMAASGDASFARDLAVGGDVYMNGSTDPLRQYLAKTYAQGYVTGAQMVTDSSHFGGAELGLLGLDSPLAGGSVFKISLAGYLRANATSSAQMILRATRNNATVAPTINSQAYMSWVFPLTAGTNSIASSFYLVGDGSDYRFLLTGKNLAGNIETWVYGAPTFPFQLVIEQVGFDPAALGNGYRNDGGGTPFANAAPAAPATPTRVTYTKTYAASTVSFRAGAKVTDGTLQQGYYGGAQRYSYAVAPQAMLNDLARSTVKSVEVQLVNKSWYYGAGGTARLSIWGGALPTSQPAETSNVVQAVPNWAPGATKWVNLGGAGTVQNWAGGSYKGVVLGEGAGTNSLYYGKFGTAVTFRATYVK